MRNVYGHVVIAVDQSHAFRVFHSAYYFPHFRISEILKETLYINYTL